MDCIIVMPPPSFEKRGDFIASVGRSGAQVLSPSLLKVAKHCLLIDGRFLCPVVKLLIFVHVMFVQYLICLIFQID